MTITIPAQKESTVLDDLKLIYAAHRAAQTYDPDKIITRMVRASELTEIEEVMVERRGYTDIADAKRRGVNVEVPDRLKRTYNDAVNDPSVYSDEEVERWLIDEKTEITVDLSLRTAGPTNSRRYLDGTASVMFEPIIGLMRSNPRAVARGESFHDINGKNRIRIDIARGDYRLAQMPDWHKNGLSVTVKTAGLRDRRGMSKFGQGADAILARYMSLPDFRDLVVPEIREGTPDYFATPLWRRPFYGLMSFTPLRSGRDIRRVDKGISKVIDTSRTTSSWQAGWLVAGLHKAVVDIEESRVWRENELAIPRVDVTAYVMDVIRNVEPLIDAQKELDIILLGDPEDSVKKQVKLRQADVNLGYAAILLAAGGLHDYRAAIRDVEDSLVRRDQLQERINQAQLNQARALQLEEWDSKFAAVVYGDAERVTENRSALAALTEQMNEVAESLRSQNDYITELVQQGMLPVAKG